MGIFCRTVLRGSLYGLISFICTVKSSNCRKFFDGLIVMSCFLKKGFPSIMEFDLGRTRNDSENCRCAIINVICTWLWTLTV